MDIYQNNKLSTIGCGFAFAPNFSFSAKNCGEKLEEELADDTVRYAVRRYLSHSDALRRRLAHASYRLRLASGKGGKSQRLRCVVPAREMEPPGGWAELRMTVNAWGVTVTRLRLTRDYPAPRPPRAQISSEICEPREPKS
ncbi:MAG: hypothetical protein LUH45_00120 [Clostridiales bacterium]|nr:hypothetical protein [Clostridiales bacterium]